jgi:acyl-coenzyme A synthetase/AMP-(fatty) acid ligase
MATLLPRFTDVSLLPKTKEVAVETIEFAESPSEDIESKVPSTINELISLRAQQSGNDRPIVAYPHEGTDYVDWSPKQLNNLVENAAAHYSSIVPQRLSSDDPVQVVGLLGNSDLDYLVAFLAISRLGHSALLLSTRITDEAYESLLASTSATALLYQDAFSQVAANMSTKLPSVRTGTTFAASLSPSSELSTGALKPSLLDPSREANNICFIIHSSGSTGLPKPIYQTHRAALYTYSQNFGLVGHITLPLYHNHGICCLFRAIHSRRKIYIYNARLPLASKHLLATLKEHSEIRILYGVPYALKLLSETEEGLKLLSRLEVVMFGGSACPKPIGDRLVESGVNLVGHYGATEVGQLMTSFRDHREDKGWEWMRVPPHLKPYLSMELRGPNLYECCVSEGWGSKVATNRDDGSYATKDLFEPHPTIADAWKYYARLDDTIALENGEKANPLLVEGVIRQNHNVAEAVVFGAGKPRLGAFIIPAETSTLQDVEIINAVMPKIEEMNASMPAYSQLSKEMVAVLPRDVDYRRTDKGTVIRAAFYRDFSKQINAAYVDKQSGTLVMARDDLLQFLQKEMQKRVSLKQGATLDEDADLFSLGVDSLQAIQVRSFILQHLKVDGEKLGRNFVFDFPTLGKMADEIIRLQFGGPERQVVGVEEQISAMIEKYAEFPQHVPVDRPADGKHIVSIENILLGLQVLTAIGCYWCHWLARRSRCRESCVAAVSA